MVSGKERVQCLSPKHVYLRDQPATGNRGRGNIQWGRDAKTRQPIRGGHDLSGTPRTTQSFRSRKNISQTWVKVLSSDQSSLYLHPEWICLPKTCLNQHHSSMILFGSSARLWKWSDPTTCCPRRDGEGEVICSERIHSSTPVSSKFCKYKKMSMIKFAKMSNYVWSFNE